MIAKRRRAEHIESPTGMRYALLNPILQELAREGRINIASGKHGDWISFG
jgi:hypothetical protein